MKIYFDMDGTIANLYGVETWLDDIIAENTRPYEQATTLVNMSHLARLLHKAQANGNEIGIISWLAKNSTAEYDEKVKDAKLGWLKKHLPSVEWDEIFIVPYGTPKETLGKGILFDDEKPNRKNWGKGAYEPKEIIKVLKGLA